MKVSLKLFLDEILSISKKCNLWDPGIFPYVRIDAPHELITISTHDLEIMQFVGAVLIFLAWDDVSHIGVLWLDRAIAYVTRHCDCPALPQLIHRRL
jgi:hypothetical protein